MRKTNVFHVLCNYLNYPKLLNALWTEYIVVQRDGVNWTLGNRYLAKLAIYYTNSNHLYLNSLFLWTGENSKIIMVNIKHDDGQ